MYKVLSLLLVVTAIGCGSKSGDAEATGAGVPLSINNPAGKQESQSASTEQTELAESVANPAVEQLIKRAKAAVVSGKPALAVEALSQAIGITPRDSRLFRMRADVYSLMGEYANARADFSLAIEADSGNAELYNVRGYFLMTRGASESATADFQKATELKPDFAAAWNNLGLIHLAREELETAEQQFTKAIEIDRKYTDALNNRGFARMKLGRLDEALQDLQAAVKLNPEYTTAWNNCGLTYMKKEDFSAAADAFSQAIKLAPLDVRWVNHRRSAYLQLKNFDLAAQDAQRISWLTSLASLSKEAAAHARDPQAWIARAEHLASGNEFGAAIQDFTRALVIAPGDTTALNGRAAAWYETGELRKAIADCDESLVASATPDAFSIRGDAWFALENYDQAISDFEAARRFDAVVAQAYQKRAAARKSAGESELASQDEQKAKRILDGLSGEIGRRETQQAAIPFPAE